jgi:predicted O-methyltransferase YrrM
LQRFWLSTMRARKMNASRCVTLEIHPAKSEYARSRMARAGLDARVAFHVRDARQALAELAGPFDFVLLDLWKDLYIPCPVGSGIEVSRFRADP